MAENTESTNKGALRAIIKFVDKNTFWFILGALVIIMLG